MDDLDGGMVAGDAISAMQALTSDVLYGQESPERLSLALETARGEVDALVQQLSDDTFATDEVAKEWRHAALEAAAGFSAGLDRMLGAVYEGVNSEQLTAGLSEAVEAESRLRDLFERALESGRMVRAHMEEAQRVPCVRCGHRNMPGGASCAQCRFPLPNIGLERIESDVVGGGPQTYVRSGLVDGLRGVLGSLDQPGGMEAAREFLANLERLQALAVRQLDAMLAHQDTRHEAVQYTVEIRRRVDEVRHMVEAVRLSLEAGDTGPLAGLAPWLEEQFAEMHELKAAVMELTGAA